MGQPGLLRLFPEVSQALLDVLDASGGPALPPIRSEIFGLQRFAQHGRSLGATHRAETGLAGRAAFFPRLRDNIRALRAAHRYIGMQAATGYDVSPAAEWLLDNFHLVEAQLKEIHEGLPRSFFRTLPVLLDEPLAGLPRIYGVAWAFVAHTDGAFDDELLVHFLGAYQETRELRLSEMWALPTTLRVLLVENLRRLAERVATFKAARELANLCCDRIDTLDLPLLDSVLALLAQRGAGRAFLAQMAQRLLDGDAGAQARFSTAQREWLQRALPDLAEAQTQHRADQTADNLSVSNAITSLRALGDADWSDIVARASVLMRVMLGSRTFEAEQAETRSQTLHAIERLARQHDLSEVRVAQALLALMQGSGSADGAASVAGHWLRGAGRRTLMNALGLHEPLARAWRAARRRLALPAYLGSLLLLTLALVARLLLRHRVDPAGAAESWWPALLGAALMVFPASEAAVAVINRLISESARPVPLPRLALAGGIAPEHRVLVVIPAMLTDAGAAHELSHRLHLHHLANPEAQAQFALLTDWADADTPQAAGDAALVQAALERLRALNTRHPAAEGMPPRFILLHRARRFCTSEQRWIGWERKRGKLEQLLALLATGEPGAFLDFGDESRTAAGTRYVLTLDSDTQLPPGRLRELVGVAAHPVNRPRLAADGRRVTGGYGILQPRVVTPLPAPREFTRFHWLFAGQCGIDPYSAASSEVYQDLFGEGSFSGKGLLDVQAMHAVLGGRLPEGQVLSHDLLEGSLARCAAVTDITLIENAPFHADVAASRVHRWTRGDWQLLPILLQPRRYPLRAINRWKMLDNLRRSLVAPMSLALLLLALTGHVVSPGAALALVVAAFSAGPLLGALAGFLPSRGDIAWLRFGREAGLDLARALGGGLWHLMMLLQNAMLAADAIGRALWRMTVSHRRLLQWTTASAAQAAAADTLSGALRRHWPTPLAAALMAVAGLWPLHTPFVLLALGLCALWAGAPLAGWWVSRPRAAAADAALSAPDEALLEGLARDTWRLFERCIGPDDHHLPPDNLQTLPHDMVAHRTSPTNIGLYLLSTACAREFGWIGTQELIARLEATLATLGSLQRHRGHFLNWYDTQTLAPLLPAYVSTVDSGNLSGHLLALAQACRERSAAPHDATALRRALALSRQRALAHQAPAPDSALARLLAEPDGLALMRQEPARFEPLLQDAADELAPLLASAAQAEPGAVPSPADERAWRLADHLATLRSAARELPQPGDAAARLQALAAACEALAWEAEFGFLYHRKRHLFHIGYRLAERELDAGFYDLLASESRLTSLLAIAKGEVPVGHWSALGRPFVALGSEAGLRSWSGSMFEYLMPALVLDEPHGSVLWSACRSAVHEQIALGRSQGVPWGISESANAGRDTTLAYQYAPQGARRLALRNTPPNELVVAPYATALAAQMVPRAACLNFVALAQMGAQARYGFIEALDFTPARQEGNDAFTPVVTFMAHHQGMSLVALANVLLDGIARRWGMANAHIEAVASLLHERAPREVPVRRSASRGAPPLVPQRRAPGLLREVQPGTTAVEPTHLLGNGRYTVALRANGAGWSRWGSSGITRWRDDALRDAHGSFFYLRWDRQPQPVSITQHPAPDPAAQYRSLFHADRVCFDAEWPELQAHTTVWVSPEDDIEFRRIELSNSGSRPLELELISAFEPTLCEARADEAHPAFMNLFVRAEWQPDQQALWFQRTPRLPTETSLQAAHFLADSDPQVLGLRVQAERARWLGRNRRPDQPLAAFDALPAADPGEALTLDTGLDPVCALAVRLRMAPGSKAQLTFATAASDSGGTLRAMIDKYRQAGNLQRASLMSATLAGIRLRALGTGAETYAAIQSLTTALVLTLTRPLSAPAAPESAGCDRRLLWRFGLSGDRPILLVMVSAAEGLGLLRSVAQALRQWSWGRVACDLVVVNAEPVSYQMALQRETAALRDRHAADTGAEPGPATTGFHLLRAEELSADELDTLQRLARVRLQADGRPLTHHVQVWCAGHERAFDERHETSTEVVGQGAAAAAAAAPSVGRFDSASSEFRFVASATQRPPRPWINVLSNPGFGAQLSEAGGGYTWARNSRMNQLTAWSNDAVADTPSEWLLLQDRRTREVWSVTPSAWGDARVSGDVAHGQGYSVIGQRRGNLEVTATWCVDADSAVKQLRLRLLNRGHRTLHLRAVAMAEWMMGAQRSDRGSVATARHHQRLPEGALTALTCTQRERSAGFGGGTAFLAVAGAAAEAADWTCDRRECFDARGRLVLPDHYGQRAGDGLDPCAALAVHIALAPGESVEHVFLLGYAESAAAARQLAATAALVPPLQRLHLVRERWDALLGATTVSTPDPLFDALVNRWLLYQTVACRLWAKAGFYQAGGATGFRDQLQDAVALAWAAPQMLREQILLCASRQFPEGDVQHWWHAPGGAGVRTHFSDDLLWLPWACVQHLRRNGDAGLLDERVPFIEGAPIPDGAEDAYYAPTVSEETASVYEHGARAIDRSLRVGAHGLPLMGSGDWNDGMNRVGSEGRGESVWLAWFLCRLVADFAPLAQARGESARARRWQAAAQGWQAALEGPAWDGAWFKRAFFDDGQPLGSQANAEARIDLVAQAWSVLSGVAPQARQQQAMAAVQARLVDAGAGLVRLLDPPFEHARPSAGYIQAYPPGVRENGGQYTHAAVWALMAQAALGHAAEAWQSFTFISPAHRAADAHFGPAYGLEPYAVAGDIYSQPPWVGRGGWSWYTGAAAWLHRAAVESIFGLRIGPRDLSFTPCLPPHWPLAELSLRRDGRTLRFILLRAGASAPADTAGARTLAPGEVLRWNELPPRSTFIVPLPVAPPEGPP